MSGTVCIEPALQAQPNFTQDWQAASFSLLEDDHTDCVIAHYVDGKGLACPMPLLKLKMALKNTEVGKSVYVTATDPNSLHDIGAFCRHTGHGLVAHQADTIFHLLITKNC